jgi:hypothetical protein
MSAPAFKEAPAGPESVPPSGQDDGAPIEAKKLRCSRVSIPLAVLLHPRLGDHVVSACW